MLSIATHPINSDQLRKTLITTSTGAVVEFAGIVRNHNEGSAVTNLDYEALEPLCIKEAQKIFAEAKAQFDIIDARCVHRTGELSVGDVAVWVGVSAAHRDAAFKACRFIIDEIKTRLPIWKKEFYADGDSGWINNAGSPTPIPFSTGLRR